MSQASPQWGRPTDTKLMHNGKGLNGPAESHPGTSGVEASEVASTRKNASALCSWEFRHGGLSEKTQMRKPNSGWLWGGVAGRVCNSRPVLTHRTFDKDENILGKCHWGSKLILTYFSNHVCYHLGGILGSIPFRILLKTGNLYPDGGRQCNNTGRRC